MMSSSKQSLLNEFISEMMKTASKESFDTAVLQQKLDAWKGDLMEKQHDQLQKREDYLQKHHMPRVERESTIQEYLEEYTRLKEVYKAASSVTRNAALRAWLTHAATLPPQVLATPSTLYTMYPYQETAFYSLPNVEKPTL